MNQTLKSPKWIHYDSEWMFRGSIRNRTRCDRNHRRRAHGGGAGRGGAQQQRNGMRRQQAGWPVQRAWRGEPGALGFFKVLKIAIFSPFLANFRDHILILAI